MSDFDDIFILFMKMEMKSCSRLGSKHQQKTTLWAVLFMYLLTKKVRFRLFKKKSDKNTKKLLKNV